MGNLITGFKKFLTNKNTVTVLGAFAMVLILYLGYNAQVRRAVEPIDVPYAIKEISPGTRITRDMIGITKIPIAMLQGSPLVKELDIINKYSNADTVIPKGSLFYPRSVVNQSQLPAGIIDDYPEGYVLVNMNIDMNSSYGNSIYPKNYIDIYLKAVNKIDPDSLEKVDDKIMVGKLIENVKILAVKDSNGRDVFANVEDKLVPSLIIFAVPEEYHILLRKAMYLRTFDATLLPIPTNESLKETPGEVKISSEELKTWINTVTYWSEDLSGNIG